jgi:hypothetical protein
MVRYGEGFTTGCVQLDEDELEVSYPGKHVSSEQMRYLSPLMDLFCLSEVQFY